MTSSKKLILIAALAASFTVPVQIFAQTGAAPAKDTTKKAAPKTAIATAPSAQEIADAKAKGLVWVNLSSKVYHKEGRYYGATKSGKFMTEADAQKAGYKAAQEGGAPKKASTKATTAAAPAKK
jgi:hypothetical protein